MHVIPTLLKVLIGVSLCVPLLAFPSKFVFPFIVPKVVVFRILVEVMIGLWLLVVIQLRNRPTLWTPISLALFLYLISLSLSTVFGVAPYHSFWDTQERMLGLFTLLHYFAFYCVAATVIKGWKHWKMFLLVFLSVSIVVALIAIAQKFDPELLVNRGYNRVSSTLGHPSYLAGFGLFSFFGSLLIVLRSEQKWLSVFGIIAAVMSLVAILLSETRGTMIGFITALFGLGFGYLFTLDRGGVARRILCMVIATLVVLFVTVFVFSRLSFFAKNTWDKAVSSGFHYRNHR